MWPALALVLFLSWPAQATPPAARLAGDDLGLSRLLMRQEREMQGASLALEEWAAGRLDISETRRRVQTAASRTRDLEAEIGRRAASAEAVLSQAATRAGRSRTSLVQGVAELLSKGGASRADLLAFNRRQGRAAADSLEGWLRARRDLTARIQGLSAAPGVAAYYRWQGSLLPLQLQELALARRLREVMDGLAEGGRPQASGLYRQGLQISDGVAALQVPPALKAAQVSASREARSLARLAEAVELMLADPSPESGARVTRCSAALRSDSARAQDDSLGALARILQS